MLKKTIIAMAIVSIFFSFDEAGKTLNIQSQSPHKQPSKIPLIADFTRRGSELIFDHEEVSLKLTEIEGLSLFYADENLDYIIEYPFLKNDGFDYALPKRIRNYNQIAEFNLPILIYQVTNARDTNWFDAENYLECAVSTYNEEFRQGLSDSIQFVTSSYQDWSHYQLYNYKTDHHWNVFGAYRGYSEIIRLIHDIYPQVGFARKPQSAYCSNVRFYGSLSDGDMENYDTICEFEYDLPDYSVTLNHLPVAEYGNRTLYHQPVDDSDPTINHYREFFGADSAEVIYDFGQNTGINILILSDSYSNAIKPVLASHFDTAVFIDLRHYLKEFNEYFDLAAYQNLYQFDLILYIGGFYTTVMDESYNINS